MRMSCNRPPMFSRSFRPAEPSMVQQLQADAADQHDAHDERPKLHTETSRQTTHSDGRRQSTLNTWRARISGHHAARLT